MHLEKVELNIVTSNYHRNYYQFSELLGLTCDYIVLQVFLLGSHGVYQRLLSVT